MWKGKYKLYGINHSFGEIVTKSGLPAVYLCFVVKYDKMIDDIIFD